MNEKLVVEGFVIVDAPEIDRASMFDSFDVLPEDKYIRGGFRRRRFSWFAGSPQKLMKLPHKLFYQTEKYEGRPDIYRSYDEIDASVVDNQSFQNIIDCFVRATEINMLNTPVEVHQIRISCGEGVVGNPSPEGVHRDGCHYLGIFVVDRDGVEGGYNSIHLAKDGEAIFRCLLDPGQFLFCNDEMVMHNAEPVSISEGCDKGHRDIFVLTAGEHRRKG